MKNTYIIILMFSLSFISSCKAKTPEDILAGYMNAVQSNDVTSQNKFNCEYGSKLSNPIDSIGDWEILDSKNQDKDGAIFFVRSGDQAREITVSRTEVVYQNTLELSKKLNYGTMRTNEAIENANEVLGVPPSERRQSRQSNKLPERKDYSKESYCVLDIR